MHQTLRIGAKNRRLSRAKVNQPSDSLFSPGKSNV
jgi:hypothetical protein